MVLISAYSFNAEREESPEIAELYFKLGLEELKKLNYMDAIINFSRAFTAGPKTYYGELAYLYLGKSYALYSYAVGSRKGIMATIGYLNQYTFHYKVPRFLHIQREFIADSYVLLQWYESAKNIYANLYGETEKPEYMIKFGYAASLNGEIEGYNYLVNLESVPLDYLDLYFMTMGFYNFNLGRYEETVDFLNKALNVNIYLREDVHLLFRMGASYYKLGDWRRAILYLELTRRKDIFRIYKERTHFYLAFINLETKNFREALENIEAVIENDNLFYSKLAQILFSSLWLYEEFLEVYKERFKNYRNLLLQIGWLNVEDVYGDLPLLGMYYYILKSKRILEEERDLIRVKNLKLTEFAIEYDLFSFEPYKEKLKETVENIVFYRKEEAELITDLYKLNRSNYLKIFEEGKGFEILVRSLVFLGDEEAEKLVEFIKDENLKKFLKAKINIYKGNFETALKLLEEVKDKLKDEDKIEAGLLYAYLKEDLTLLESVASKVNFEDERFKNYRVLVLLKLADGFYETGNYKKAKKYYTDIVETLEPQKPEYWWALFRLALIGEITDDKELIEWVVKKSEGGNNIWSRAISVIWGM